MLNNFYTAPSDLFAGGAVFLLAFAITPSCEVVCGFGGEGCLLEEICVWAGNVIFLSNLVYYPLAENGKKRYNKENR
jgi:hypothetical protein